MVQKTFFSLFRVISAFYPFGYDLKKAEKRVLEAVRPSVRHSSVRPYPRFILTRNNAWVIKFC